MVDLCIGGLRLRLVADERVLAAVRARYREFVAAPAGAASAELRVEAAAAFEPGFEHEAAARIRPRDASSVELDGAASGFFDLAARRGGVDGARGLGAVDALVRAALSLLLPLDGALLVHGALVPGGRGARVFSGASGSGKSTVAAAFGGACDELVVLRPEAGGVRAEATPYWQGRREVARLESLIALRRGVAPGQSSLAGARAARRLLSDVVRYVALPETDRALLSVVARVCAAVPLVELACPEGAAFLPYLRGRLEELAA